MKEEDNLLLNQSQSFKWDEGIIIVLAAIIILIPIVFYPYCVPVFSPIKDVSFQILSLFALTLWMLKIISLNRLDRKVGSLDRPLFLFLLIGCLSLIRSINLFQSILALPLFLAGPVLYFIVSGSFKNQKIINRLLFIVIIVGTILGAYGILQYLGIDFKFWAGNIGRNQVMGLFGNVNYFAEYLILPLTLSLGLFLSKEKVFPRFFLLIALIIMGLAIFLTFTRGSYLATGVSIAVMLVLYYKSASSLSIKQYYKKIILYCLLFLIIVLAIVYIPHPLNQGNTALGRLRSRVNVEALTQGSSALRRSAIWQFTWIMIKDRFILGSGLGTYGYHSLKYQADFFFQGQNRDIYPHGYAMQAHNEYLQIWSELGMIGLFCFLWILFSYYRTILIHFQKMKEKDRALTIGLTGGVTAVLLDALFGFPLQLAASLSLFWIFIGLTVAQINLINAYEKENKAQVQTKADIGNRVIAKLPRGIMIRKIILSLLVVVMMAGVSWLLIRPFVARVYWYYGNQQIATENDNQLIKIYEKGLKWNPWLGELYYNIATILSDNDLNTPALDYYHRAAKYMDQHYLPQNIARIYLKKGALEEAIPYLEKAIAYQQSRQDMVPLYINLGNSWLTLKQYHKAEQSFLVAVSIDPRNVNAYYGLAGAYLSQGKKESGIKSLQKVIELDPNSKAAGYAGVLLKKYELEDTMSEDLVN